jgi:hypothetical protein
MVTMRSPNSPPSLAPALHKNRQHFAERDLGICSRCCARAASGQVVAALPRSVMNSRRLNFHASQQTVWSADKEREPVPVTGNAERSLPDARRTLPRSPKGK